jgi:hypothetical protein
MNEMSVPTGWLRKMNVSPSPLTSKQAVSSRPRKSSEPATPAPQTHVQDSSKTLVCFLRSGGLAKPGQMQSGLKKVQRSSATRSLLERRSPLELQSYAEPGSQDGYARRRSANTVPYSTLWRLQDERLYALCRIPGQRTKGLSLAHFQLLSHTRIGVYCYPSGCWSSNSPRRPWATIFPLK